MPLSSWHRVLNRVFHAEDRDRRIFLNVGVYQTTKHRISEGNISRKHGSENLEAHTEVSQVAVPSFPKPGISHTVLEVSRLPRTLRGLILMTPTSGDPQPVVFFMKSVIVNFCVINAPLISYWCYFVQRCRSLPF